MVVLRQLVFIGQWLRTRCDFMDRDGIVWPAGEWPWTNSRVLILGTCEYLPYVAQGGPRRWDRITIFGVQGPKCSLSALKEGGREGFHAEKGQKPVAPEADTSRGARVEQRQQVSETGRGEEVDSVWSCLRKPALLTP